MNGLRIITISFSKVHSRNKLYCVARYNQSIRVRAHSNTLLKTSMIRYEWKVTEAKGKKEKKKNNPADPSNPDSRLWKYTFDDDKHSIFRKHYKNAFINTFSSIYMFRWPWGKPLETFIFKTDDIFKVLKVPRWVTDKESWQTPSIPPLCFECHTRHFDSSYPGYPSTSEVKYY